MVVSTYPEPYNQPVTSNRHTDERAVRKAIPTKRMRIALIGRGTNRLDDTLIQHVTVQRSFSTEKAGDKMDTTLAKWLVEQSEKEEIYWRAKICSLHITESTPQKTEDNLRTALEWCSSHRVDVAIITNIAWCKGHRWDNEALKTIRKTKKLPLVCISEEPSNLKEKDNRFYTADSRRALSAILAQLAGAVGEAVP